MIVMLLFLYPMLGANQLVGTDLTQAVPLTAAAALGALAFGHVEFSVTTSIIIGSIPAVIVGSFISSRAPDRYIRPAITFVIFASGLKYVGLGHDRLSAGSSVRPSSRSHRMWLLTYGRGRTDHLLSLPRRSLFTRTIRSRPDRLHNVSSNPLGHGTDRDYGEVASASRGSRSCLDSHLPTAPQSWRASIRTLG